MYQKLFKKWKTTIGFAAFTIVTVIVLFSGENSLVSQLRNAFGEHEEIAADEPVAVETVHPVAEPEVVMDQEEPSFVEDEELIDDGEGFDPTPPEENVDGNSDDGGGEEEHTDGEENGSIGEQVIVVNPGAPQPS